MALFWGEARGSLGKNLKEGCGRGFEAGERVVSTEGTMVTKFSPPGLPPGGETSASFKGRRTFRTGALLPPWKQPHGYNSLLSAQESCARTFQHSARSNRGGMGGLI